jgi:hypothetical protein
MQKGGGLNPQKIWAKYKEPLLEKLRNDTSFLEGIHGPPDTLPKIFLSPNGTYKYAEWIVKSYIDNGIKRVEDIQSRAYPEIEDFNRLITTNKLSKGDPKAPWTNETDINNLCGLVGCVVKGKKLKGLSDLIDRHREFLDNEAVPEEGKSKPIYKDRDVTVFHPETKAQACYYGRGTRWCTAATKGENMYDSYNEDGPMYIVIPKKTKYVGEKYQLHFASSQFMDEKDDPIILHELLNRLPQIIPVVFQTVKKTKQLEIYINKEHRDYDNYIINIKGHDIFYMSSVDKSCDPSVGECSLDDTVISITTGRSVSLIELYSLSPELLPIRFTQIKVIEDGVLYSFNMFGETRYVFRSNEGSIVIIQTYERFDYLIIDSNIDIEPIYEEVVAKYPSLHLELMSN